MFMPRACGCKGQRTCLICEAEYGLKPEEDEIQRDEKASYVFCPQCGRSWPGWNADAKHLREEHATKHVGVGDSIDYPGGIYLQEDFISEKEEFLLMQALDDMPWDSSQSGRRKQNFGPKTNFNKRIMKIGGFKGFPATTKLVQEKFKAIPILEDFITVEQCSLEYDPLRGASINPHIDDCYFWGERVVTVNLRGDAVLTLTRYNGQESKYNLKHAPEPKDWYQGTSENGREDVIVRVPMPSRSLIVLTGAARYRWLHSVLRSDITERRVCLAYRELTKGYLPGPQGHKWSQAEEILSNATKFWMPQ